MWQTYLTLSSPLLPSPPLSFPFFSLPWYDFFELFLARCRSASGAMELWFHWWTIWWFVYIKWTWWSCYGPQHNRKCCKGIKLHPNVLYCTALLLIVAYQSVWPLYIIDTWGRNENLIWENKRCLQSFVYHFFYFNPHAKASDSSLYCKDSLFPVTQANGEYVETFCIASVCDNQLAKHRDQNIKLPMLNRAFFYFARRTCRKKVWKSKNPNETMPLYSCDFKH